HDPSVQYARFTARCRLSSLAPGRGRNTVIAKEDQSGDLPSGGDREVTSPCKPPRLVGPIGLDRNLHDAFSGVIDEAQWDYFATSVCNRVESIEFLAPAQQSSASLKDDAVLGEQVGDA